MKLFAGHGQVGILKKVLDYGGIQVVNERGCKELDEWVIRGQKAFDSDSFNNRLRKNVSISNIKPEGQRKALTLMLFVQGERKRMGEDMWSTLATGASATTMDTFDATLVIKLTPSSAVSSS